MLIRIGHRSHLFPNSYSPDQRCIMGHSIIVSTTHVCGTFLIYFYQYIIPMLIFLTQNYIFPSHTTTCGKKAMSFVFFLLFFFRKWKWFLYIIYSIAYESDTNSAQKHTAKKKKVNDKKCYKWLVTQSTFVIGQNSFSISARPHRIIRPNHPR